MSIVTAVLPGMGADLEPWYFAITPLGPIPVTYVDAIETTFDLEEATRVAITLKFGDMWKALRPLRGMAYHSFSWN